MIQTIAKEIEGLRNKIQEVENASTFEEDVPNSSSANIITAISFVEHSMQAWCITSFFFWYPYEQLYANILGRFPAIQFTNNRSIQGQGVNSQSMNIQNIVQSLQNTKQASGSQSQSAQDRVANQSRLGSARNLNSFGSIFFGGDQPLSPHWFKQSPTEPQSRPVVHPIRIQL